MRDLYGSPIKRATLFTVVTCLLLFQNCSGFSGFKSSQQHQLSEDQGESGTDESGAIRLKSISGRALSPLEIEFPQTTTHDLKEMPPGAIFDENSQRLLWLPQKHQTGSFDVRFENAKGQPFTFEIILDGIEEKDFKEGPPVSYKDEDVGYVFVHGAGSVDRCQDREDLAKYWGAGIDLVAPQAAQRLVACYDGRQRAARVAPGVANQILNASCGKFNKCIVITHSMGGLVMEHMFTHTRPPRIGDPEPALYQHRDLYQQVKDKTLLVISIASAAGGSKVASIVNDPEQHELTQTVIGQTSRWLGKNDDSTKNLTVDYASHVVAPMHEDGKIPFFMVAGYSERIIRDPGAFFDNWWDQITDNDEDKLKVFNGSSTLTTLDSVVQFDSRSDGLVSFRSACGVLSADRYDGPGHDSELEKQMNYCFHSEKKPNHYAWFTINLNHFFISTPWDGCSYEKRPCRSTFIDKESGSLYVDPSLIGQSALHVIRYHLTKNPGPAYVKHVIQDEQRSVASSKDE